MIYRDLEELLKPIGEYAANNTERFSFLSVHVNIDGSAQFGFYQSIEDRLIPTGLQIPLSTIVRSSTDEIAELIVRRLERV